MPASFWSPFWLWCWKFLEIKPGMCSHRQLHALFKLTRHLSIKMSCSVLQLSSILTVNKMFITWLLHNPVSVIETWKKKFSRPKPFPLRSDLAEYFDVARPAYVVPDISGIMVTSYWLALNEAGPYPNSHLKSLKQNTCDRTGLIRCIRLQYPRARLEIQ